MSETDSKPVVVVLGATGSQGSSVVKHLLGDRDSTFSVRAVTRNVDSPKAKELSGQGVEVVRADLEDLESLRNAFAGAYGVFGVTNFWETMEKDTEIRQGRNLVDAAQAAKVKHFVWSTLDHTSNPAVTHWDSKAVVDDYLKSTGVPRTSLYTSFYYENFIALPPFMFKKTEDGKILAEWPLALTDGPIGGYSVGDTGAYVLEALKKPEEWIGKDMRIASDIFTPRQFVDAVRKVTGREIVFKETDRETFEGAKSIIEEVWSNMEWFYIHSGNPGRDLDLTERIYPARDNFYTFVEANKAEFLNQFDSES